MMYTSNFSASQLKAFMEIELKNKITDKLASYLETLESAVSSGYESAQEQMPLLVQEYLSLYFWDSLISFSLCFIMMVCGLVIIKKIWNWASKYDKGRTGNYNPYPPAILIPIFLLFCLSFLWIPLYYNLKSTIKVVVAPRVVILEEVKSLITSRK